MSDKSNSSQEAVLGFERVYSSSNGSVILKVIHEFAKAVDDRVHPPSYLAFVNLTKFPGTFRVLSRMHDAVHENYSGVTDNLRRLCEKDQEMVEFFSGQGEHSMSNAEPLTGFYHDTLWSAQAAIGMDEDPSNILMTFEKVAMEERRMEGRANAQRLRERHFDGLAEAVAKSAVKGTLPLVTETHVEEIGGGIQALALRFRKVNRDSGNSKVEYEDLYVWVTDFDETIIGVYDSAIDGDEGHTIILRGDEGLEDPHAIKEVVETLETMVKFARLLGELY